MSQRSRIARAKQILPALATLASGEGVSRLSNLLLLIFISHKFGVRITGSFALAHAVALYLTLGIDMGLRHIGAALLANHPGKVREITHLVQRKRSRMTLLLVPLGVLFGCFGPLPPDSRLLVSLFAVSVAGYALSLDWVAWGLHSFRWVAVWRGSASLSAAAISIGLILVVPGNIAVTAFGNAAGYLLAGFLLWVCWWRRSFSSTSTLTLDHNGGITNQLTWRPALSMGAALLLNQAFNNIDLLLLGAYSDSHEVGLYNAAYRMILLVLGIYYLVTQSLYPTLARWDASRKTLSAIKLHLALLLICGVLLSLLLYSCKNTLLLLLYGPKFSAAGSLLSVLVLALPLDFLTSFLCNAMVAWGYSRRVLISTTTALAANIGLNLYLLPRFHAFGAAWATVASYFVLLLMMLITLSRQRTMAPAGFQEAAG